MNAAFKDEAEKRTAAVDTKAQNARAPNPAPRADSI
jgi:hypothetical protein